jgi:hypothetical protein
VGSISLGRAKARGVRQSLNDIEALTKWAGPHAGQSERPALHHHQTYGGANGSNEENTSGPN